VLRVRERQDPSDAGPPPDLEAILARTGARSGPVRCRFCATTVTRADAACERLGRHAHRLTNPAGLTFDLRCYRNAPGCRDAGTPVAEHSWFPPARWSLAHCAGCGAHLGWFFHEAGGRFAGLVADRLDLAGPAAPGAH
jgi:hypothetical protein